MQKTVVGVGLLKSYRHLANAPEAMEETQNRLIKPALSVISRFDLNADEKFPCPDSATGAGFLTTQWTTILEAARPGTQEAHEAFGRLYMDYWKPLYAYVRRRGFLRTEAEDLTQNFFVHLLQKQSLTGMSREGGRFRSFLLCSLENFLANEWDRVHAQKRGSGARPLSLDADEMEARIGFDAPDAATPESLFERQWVCTVLDHVRTRLQEDYANSGRAELFARLSGYLAGEKQAPAYALTAAECGMTVGALKVAVHRMRQRYGELLREEIARTVSSPDEVRDELRYLINIVAD